MFRQLSLDIFVVGLVISLVHWISSSHRRRGLSLPPGPRGVPIIGSLFSVPRANECIIYRDWGLKYGSDLIHFGVFGTHTIVVNSAKATKDLFSDRSALYSDRYARTLALTRLHSLGFNWALVFASYGPRWRALRKGVQEQFHRDAARAFEPIEEFSAHALLRELVKAPEGFLLHIRHMAGRIIMRIAYGIDIRPHNDPYVHMAEEALQAISVGSQFGGLLFDMVPFLQKMPSWFPGTRMRGILRGKRPVADAMFEKAWVDTAKAVAEGTAQPSVAVSNLGKQETPWKSNQAIPANIYIAGADTTVSSIQSFFLAMVLYPDAQRKAQEEIDRVLAGSRLPTFDDAKSLPYVNALVKEVLRWHPVAPLGVAHRVTVDDVYEGHFIPKGSTILGNIWAILHDPTVFPEPESFRPEHFLVSEHGGSLPPDAALSPEAAFGFGRRICPGRHMARASVWIVVANVLAAFDIGPARDKDGRVVPVKEEYTSGIVAYPSPFECKIMPRSEKARELVMATEDEALV
ncbi:cytochrome P450 [Vararia minispora EC-137]|uniref:Cytochrome P450 n=1 Tax=Vararia minispora EC-137 TaxID=1314806 RepID=A0ACB8Q8G5_9AGAM|nr:cytochrome P450 [Vararia minispora EC-137]